MAHQSFSFNYDYTQQLACNFCIGMLVYQNVRSTGLTEPGAHLSDAYFLEKAGHLAVNAKDAWHCCRFVCGYLDPTAAPGPCVGDNNRATFVTALNRQRDEMQEKKPPQNTFNADFAGGAQEFSFPEHSQTKMKLWCARPQSCLFQRTARIQFYPALNYSSISTALSSSLYKLHTKSMLQEHCCS